MMRHELTFEKNYLNEVTSDSNSNQLEPQKKPPNHSPPIKRTVKGKRNELMDRRTIHINVIKATLNLSYRNDLICTTLAARLVVYKTKLLTKHPYGPHSH